MLTRTRTRGSENGFISINGEVDVNSIVTGEYFATLSNGFTTVERIGFPWETMTDSVGSSREQHNVVHRKRWVTIGNEAYELYHGPVYSAGSLYGPIRRTYNVWVPYAYIAAVHDGHLGQLNGLKALAIARIPAYAPAQLEAFISLVEMRELVDSSAGYAAAALARFAANVWRMRRGGGPFWTRVSREGKRSLEWLVGDIRRRGKLYSPKDIKEAFKTFLASMSALSGADMEWKYGYAPMIRDIQACNKAVSKIGELRANLIKGIRMHGTAAATFLDSGIDSRFLVDGYLRTGGIDPHLTEWEKTTTITARASIVRSLSPANPLGDVDWFTALDAVLEINGLNPSAKKLWQLLPLSFVIDWFWNVSNLLESCETLKRPIGAGILSHSGLYSEKTETTVTSSASFANAVDANPRVVTGHHSLYTRAVNDLSDRPVLYIPPLDLPTKAGKWFSMAQIAFQRIVG